MQLTLFHKNVKNSEFKSHIYAPKKQVFKELFKHLYTFLRREVYLNGDLLRKYATPP